MIKNRKLVLIIIVIIISVSLIYIFNLRNNSQSEEIETGLEEGKRAPSITLTNLKGEEIKLEDLQGKMVFLNFWASWCGPCDQEMPDIAKLYKKHSNNVEVAAVNMGENRDKVYQYLSLRGLDIPVYLDSDKNIASKYSVRAIPTTYILDKDGIILKKHVGILNYQQMIDLLKLDR